MAKKKETGVRGWPAKCFFAEELKGRSRWLRATGLKLCRLAGELAAHQPWARLAETNLVFVHDAVRGENDACSVMGMLGEVFSVMCTWARRESTSFRSCKGRSASARGDVLCRTSARFRWSSCRENN